MKKNCLKSILSLALVALGMAMPASAQTNTARVNGSAYTAVADGATRFYLYNVGTGRFMINGGNWGEYGMTLEQDYGSTFLMTSAYLIDTRMVAESQSSDAHYLGLNVPGVTSAGTYGDTNAFGPIYEANSTYSGNNSITGTRNWNFTRVETADGATTYTYYMYETLNSTNYYMGVGYGINGDDSNNNTTLNTWETLEDENMGTMTTDDVTATDKKEYYQWRLVTEKELKDLLAADAQASEESFGGLNVDCSYLINSGEFTRNTSTEMTTYWKTSNSGTDTSNGYRYDWRKSATTSEAWNHSVLTLTTPYDNKAQGQYSFASFEGVGSFYQEIDMTDMPTGYYEVSFDAIALGNVARASVTNGESVNIAVSTGYSKTTAAGNLAIAQALPDNNHVMTFNYTAGSGNVTITFTKDNATKSSYDYRYRRSSWDSYTYYYHDTDLLAVDNLRMHFIGEQPEVFDEDYTDADTYVLDRTFTTKTVLLHRTFTLGKWNSLVLPFNMTTAQVKECFGSEVKLAQLTGVDGTLGDGPSRINFTSVALPSEGNAITAGSFYIINLTQKPDHYKISTIDGDFYKVGRRAYNGVDPLVPTVTQDDKLVAQGTYVTTLEEECEAGSYVFSGGDIYHLETAHNVKGFRFWMTKYVGENAKFSINDFDPETTSIDGISVKSQTPTQGVYTINGQKVSNEYVENLPKGIYIINGKKVVIK